jgi:hypothetical protein
MRPDPRQICGHLTDISRPRHPLAAGRDSEYPLSMPNRQEMEPDRRLQEQARRKRRNVLLRDAYWAIFVAHRCWWGEAVGALLSCVSRRTTSRAGTQTLEGHLRLPQGAYAPQCLGT